MHFLVSKGLTSMVVKFFKLASLKAVFILFQVSTARMVISFFSIKVGLDESLNNLPVEEAAM